MDENDPRYSENLRQVRQWGEQNEARAKAAEAKVTEAEARLAALELKDRQNVAAATAKEKGLTDKQFEALTALQPDPSVEAIEAFAAAFVTDKVNTGDENQPEDLMPGTEPLKPTAPPAPITGGNLKGGQKDFSTEDFARVAKSGNEAELRQMADLVARDPSRLVLKHGDMIPAD
jgi:hypothetical protein